MVWAGMGDSLAVESLAMALTVELRENREGRRKY